MTEEINKIVRFTEQKVASAEEGIRIREVQLRMTKEGLEEEEKKLETLQNLMVKVREMEDMMKVREMEDPDRVLDLNRDVKEMAAEAVRKMTAYMEEVREAIESQEALLVLDKEELAFRNLELELVRLAVEELKIH